MSEDRTQPASKRRLQIAREQGQVAHSPELTAAGGWLVAVLLLGFWGEELAGGLIGLTQRSVGGVSVRWVDGPAFVSHIRQAVMAVAVPLGVILTGFAAGAFATHQLQVRGLWAVGLIAPDPTRLWILGRGGGMAAGIEKIAWSVIKAVVLVGVAFVAIRSQWGDIQRLCDHEFPALAVAASSALIQPARALALAMLVLGVADFGLRHIRYEAILRTTQQEQREDVRVMEGDVSLRAKRRRLARAWQSDATELLAGASLVLKGDDGLTLVLGGGPPPRRITVCNVAQGTTGKGLRRSALASRLPQVDTPDLARRLARHAATGARLPAALTVELMREVAAVWPAQIS
jgi:flagellar biosynthesis protein FlhB